MATEIITRAEAIARGLKTYFTGKPCCRGHITSRNVDRRNCPVCVELLYRSEDQLAKARDRYRRGGEAAKERAAKWIRNNPDRFREYKANWTRANPHKTLEYVHKRRALKAGAQADVAADQIAALKDRQHGKCAGCLKRLGARAELDHITPLSRGGQHVLSNLQMLCRTCNRRKHAKDPIAWAQENGRLL